MENKQSNQQVWKEKTTRYTHEINSFLKVGFEQGWDTVGDEPEDNGREKLVPSFLQAIRAANNNGDLEKLREDWPLAHSPLIANLEEDARSISEVCILNDGTIVARIGSSHEAGYVVEIKNDVTQRLEGIDLFGKCPNKEYFAYTKPEGIKITKGWLGEEVCMCPYPTGVEDIPEGFSVKPFKQNPSPSKLIPFPDGSKVLFISSEGIFVLSASKAIRLHPTTDALREQFSWMAEEYPDDDLEIDISMEHAAISPCGQFIAVGSQDSTHLIYDRNYKLIGDIGNMSEYPHHAVFSADSKHIAFNSCHFYNGVTLCFPTDLLPDFKSESYEEHASIQVIDDGARVYASVCLADKFILGDASGNIKAIGFDGTLHWSQFIGSTIDAIDISEDEKTIVVTTCAGFISIINLDEAHNNDYEIAYKGHHETRRWIFWKSEDKPLMW